ncbi:MAG: aminomethyltransferase family protein [Candidatus Rokuibacteriota bacterium]
MLSRLPLHALHLAAGAVLDTRNGWELPASYGDPAAEYAAVRQGVGLIDRGDLDALVVTGRDRAAFLHAMLTNDVKSLAPGQGARAALLDIHGKVQVILLLLVDAEEICALAPPAMATPTLEALDKYLFSEKAYLKDASAEFAPLVVVGPEAPALVQRLAGTVPGEVRWSHEAASIGGTAVRLVRAGVDTGEPEIWLLGRAVDGPALWRAVLAAGARPVGRAAQAALRIEAGAVHYGLDVDGTVLLPEIPSADLVSYTKGCYIGQEVVIRIRDRGHVNRHLRGLLVDGTEVPLVGTEVLVGDVKIGKVTSAAWSYGRGRPVALAFVRRQHAEPGTVVTLRAGLSRWAATVSGLPFSR